MTAVEDSISYSCADPPPQIITYTNSVTNETKTESIPTKINSLHVVFDYSIFHADYVSFNDDNESKGLLETITDTVTDTVNNLFKGDSNDNDEGRDNLIALEKCMTDNLWQEILSNDKMTWVEGDETQCAGLMIDETSRRLQDESNTLAEIEQEEPFVTDGTAVDQAQPIVIADAGMDQTQPEAIDDVDTNETTAELSNTTNDNDGATTFSGTKLIGIDSLPMDSINTAGCAIGSKTCTSVRGVMSASYIGTNENAVSEVIARMLQEGMSTGSLLCEGSPVEKLEFAAFVGTNYRVQGGAHDILILNTDRGMAPPPENLTKYGMMFVIFVALLGTGVVVGVLYKRKKMKRKAMGAAAVRDFSANLELEEGSRSDTPELSVQTEDNVTKMVEMSETGGVGENEVELSLSPKSVT